MFYPILLVFFCVFNYFEVYGKIMSMCGHTIFDPKSKYTTEKIEEGLELLNKSKLFF